MGSALSARKHSTQLARELSFVEGAPPLLVISIPPCTAPERLRGFMRLHFYRYAEKHSELSLHSTLDEETFNILFRNFVDQERLPDLDPSIDPYELFLTALSRLSDDWSIVSGALRLKCSLL
ncbi:hypothetical protein DL93DRAFT_1782126 [Clavulina sp. PMI_390]|nr:hypothetical protein DL93DRAFT_1782126 [Clavulina sp. PMI_390]